MLTECMNTTAENTTEKKYEERKEATNPFWGQPGGSRARSLEAAMGDRSLGLSWLSYLEK